MIRSTFVKAAALVAVVGSAAQAQTIFDFTGAAQIRDPNPAPGATTGELFIDFLTNSETANFNQGEINGQIRAVEDTDLLGVAINSTGSIRDLRATPTGFVGQQNPFITIGSYTFSLDGSSQGNTFGPISVFQTGSSSLAAFEVTGTVTGQGLNPGARFTGTFTSPFNGITPAQLIQQIDNGTITPASFAARFQIQNAAVIPEPSTYALMASGVAMLGVFARRRRTQA